MAGSDHLQPQQFDYQRGGHESPAPNDEGTSAPMHHLDDVMPGVYTHPQYYRHDPAFDHESVKPIQAVRGKPDADVTVYRAVPHGVKEINPGDWVTPSHTYAQQHGYHADDPKQDLPVISRKVKAGHLYNEGYIHEFGWHPPKKSP